MDVRSRRVSEVMQREVVSLSRDERLDLVEDVMRLGRIRHMPVLEDGRVVGVVSSRDLLASSLSRSLDFEPEQRRAFLRAVEVAEVMSDEVVSVSPDATLREAAELMVKRRFGCLPVVDDDGDLVGLVTETDLLRAALLSDGAPEESHEHVGAWLETELQALRRTRDELEVQLHLGGAEARERWEQLGRKLADAETRARQLLREAKDPVRDVGEALRALVDEIREGYRRIRESL